VLRWLATFSSVVLAGASILLALWAVGLILFPHEEIHFEYAIPALLFAIIGAAAAIVLWRRGL
jgi:hypothetical protein